MYAYGSLMWDPGFRLCPAKRGTAARLSPRFLHLFHRYRGTVEQPGLVLGLDRGGACRGIAYQVARRQTERALEHLWLREMPRRIYRPRLVPDRYCRRTRAGARLYRRPGAPGYAGRLSLEETAAHDCARRCGARGANIEYLVNTLRHLEALGVHDPGLRRIAFGGGKAEGAHILSAP